MMPALLLEAAHAAMRQRILEVPTSSGFHAQQQQLEVQPAPPECHDWPGRWHSQYKQDYIISKLSRRRRGGFFIDLAANDAFLMSNSRSLERDYAWSGLCIEPNPYYHPNLLKYRNCTVIGAAVSNVAGPARFDFRQDGVYKQGGKGVYGKVNEKGDNATTKDVWIVTLSEILERTRAPREIDFMSLDVEGHEEKAMSTFPWSTHVLNFMVVEVVVHQPKRLFHNLTKHGLREICTFKPGNDRFWARNESLVEHESLRAYLGRIARGEQRVVTCALLASWVP